MFIARRIVLSLIAFVFAGVALGNVVAIDAMAEGVGQALGNVDARNEHRAIYVGLWIAHALIFGWAALRHDRERVLYDVCTLLLAGQLVGRAVSVVVDGIPSAKLWPMCAAETIGVVALVLLRPRR